MKLLKLIIIMLLLSYLAYNVYNIKHIENMVAANVKVNSIDEILNKMDTYNFLINTEINGKNYYINYGNTKNVCINDKEVICGLYTAVIAEQRNIVNIEKFNKKDSDNSTIFRIKLPLTDNITKYLFLGNNILLGSSGVNVCFTPSLPDYNNYINSNGINFELIDNQFVIVFKDRRNSSNIIKYYVCIYGKLCNTYYKLGITNDINKALKFNIYLS